MNSDKYHSPGTAVPPGVAWHFSPFCAVCAPFVRLFAPFWRKNCAKNLEIQKIMTVCAEDYVVSLSVSQTPPKKKF